MDFSVFDKNYSKKIINQRISCLGLLSTEEYLEYNNQNPTERDLLHKALFNHHSEFFRNRNNFNYLEYAILPQLIKEKTETGKKEIRIWSAACAAGQEAYSIAIICNELSQFAHSQITFRIFASDISKTEIEKAKNGAYTTNDLNNVTLKRLNKNFTNINGSYLINEELKSNIEFSTFDLLDKENLNPSSSIFGGFDIIFCNNLLFYYNNSTRTEILNKITNTLMKRGFLTVDEAETGIINANKQYICIMGSSIFRKMI